MADDPDAVKSEDAPDDAPADAPADGDAPPEDPDAVPAEGDDAAEQQPTSNVPTYEQIEECANFIRETTNTTAKIAVVTGASMGILPKCCISGEEVTCSRIPHIGACVDADDDCDFCPNIVYSGMAGSTPVLAISGRPHVVHEQIMIAKTAQFVKSFKLLGVEMMILVCPAGALNSTYKVGDIMIVKDHINFMGLAGYNPLMGRYDEKFGPKYLSLNAAYCEEHRRALQHALKEACYDGNIFEGVYVAITGPVYPTPAEKQFLRGQTIGDAVGMYLIPEILLSKFCGLNVVAMCIITDEAQPGSGESNYDNVESVIGEDRMAQVNTAIETLIQKLDPTKRETASTGPCCRCSRKKK